MLFKKFLAAGFIAAVLFSQLGCKDTAVSSSGPISEDKIVNIKIDFLNDSIKDITYSRDIDAAKVRGFLAAFNSAAPYRNDVGTTPSIDIIINFTDGTSMTVSGGTQGFQIVTYQGRQYNISGEELNRYFRVLYDKYLRKEDSD